MIHFTMEVDLGMDMVMEAHIADTVTVQALPGVHLHTMEDITIPL